MLSQMHPYYYTHARTCYLGTRSHGNEHTHTELCLHDCMLATRLMHRAVHIGRDILACTVYAQLHAYKHEHTCRGVGWGGREGSGLEAWMKSHKSPAPVAQWLARRTVGRKVWGSNPIRVMWDLSALAGAYPELGVLWAQWEGWNHTAELHPLNGCVFEGVAPIT